MAQDNRRILSIRISDEQYELLTAMWNHDNWDLDIVDDGLVNENDIIHEGPVPLIQPDQEAEECPFCFCRPCVTDPRFTQAWWDHVHPPHKDNNKHRKPIYKRFWVMLANRAAWQDPRYVRKKQLALVGEYEFYAWAGPSNHRRDIMPDCVLKLVRYWRPNPPGQPYMGHKWF